MFPAIQIFHLHITGYLICTIIGIAAACIPSVLAYKKRGGDDISMIFVYISAAVGVLIGSHLLFGITNIRLWGSIFEQESFLKGLLRFGDIFSGSVFYGGLLGGMLAGMISIKAQKLEASLVTDCMAFAAPLFHGFGRIGCFCTGCCFGVESEYGIVLNYSSVEEANGVPRVPVQLYEAAFVFVIAAVLAVMLKKGLMKGKLFQIYLLAYSVGRFILEFWRGDEYRGFLFGLSTSQNISIVVFAVTSVLFIFSPQKQREQERKDI